uniref:Uncharacterized protein n=1 Tax=Anguilla anguilla TaxID=7936 RepID=A0A0E9QIS8_ANGAN
MDKIAFIIILLLLYLLVKTFTSYPGR